MAATWARDKLTTFVEEYQTALDGLEKDQVSGLVTTNYGIHIIKCTDVFTAPEEVTSMDQIPVEFTDSIKKSIESSSRSQAYSDWYAGYKESAEIVINDMPADVSYNVDTTGVTPSTSEDVAAPGVPGGSSTDDAATESADQTDQADGEQAADEQAEGAEESATDSAQVPETDGTTTAR